jgi:pyruvate kinase
VVQQLCRAFYRSFKKSTTKFVWVSSSSLRLGMEIPLERIFWVQKMMIRKANLSGKPVITATQMLDSMIAAPRPTRAEATDVANAVLDGTDCVMLSGETAAGAYPRESVEIMAGICEEAEQCVDNWALSQALLNSTMAGSSAPLSTIEALASSTVLTSAKVQAACIVVLAANGDAARMIAKYRPAVPVVVGVVPRSARQRIGFAEKELRGHQVARQLMLTRGLIPVVVDPMEDAESEEGSESSAPMAAKKCIMSVGLALFTTLFCSQNTVQLMTASIVCPCNQSDTRECQPYMSAVQHAMKMGLCRPGDKVVAMYNVEKRCAVVRVIEIMEDDAECGVGGLDCQLKMDDEIPVM